MPSSREESVAADHEAAIMLVKNQPVLALDRQSQPGACSPSGCASGESAPNLPWLDSFDTIIALVALGMGCALVPQRSLAAFRNQRAIRRLAIAPKPVRTLALITRATPRRRSTSPNLSAKFLF
ncbi:MAG: LysR substrate-binding domain-containing protein [Verrucomicrobiales bacterium]